MNHFDHLSVFLGLLIGNLIFHFRSRDWSAARDQSFWQGTALLTHWLVTKLVWQ